MLQFKELKQGDTVFILDKQNLDYREDKICKISLPYMELGKTNMVVDISMENGQTYKIPDSLSVTYAGTMVLSTDKSLLVRDVEQVRSNAETIVKSVENNKRIVERAGQLLVELNPAEKEKAKNEERFSNLETSVSEMKGMLSSLLKKLE